MPPLPRLGSPIPLAAAERAGADYVMLGNTYGYGLVDGAADEDLPQRPSSVKGRVRAQMWRDAEAAHRAVARPAPRLAWARPDWPSPPGPVGAFRIRGRQGGCRFRPSSLASAVHAV
ncbi:hypothetical protein OV450_1724 [Actinobacteria bacterium OV450]|nr:hypothetical protein OV450_1724 [Actinobacteria bacterium OV450]